jgi:hypothetical protein
MQLVPQLLSHAYDFLQRQLTERHSDDGGFVGVIGS